MTAHGELLALRLHHMRQLMGKQPPAAIGIWRELARTEGNVAPDGEGLGVDGSCRLAGGHIGMYPDMGKIATEARLHEGRRRRVERLAGRTQALVHGQGQFAHRRTRGL